MIGIKHIVFEKNSECLTISINEECRISYNGISKIINNELIFKYLNTLLSIIDDWKEKYSNTKTIDGGDWKLLITYIDNSEKRFYGHAEFPPNFEAIERLNHELIKAVI